MKSNNLKTKIMIIILIIMALAVVALWLFFNTDIFRTKRGAFLRYFETTEESLELLKTTDFSKYNNLKENKAYVRKADMTIQSSSNVADSNILDKIKFVMTEKVNNKDEQANAEISIKSGDKELANISYVKEKDIYGLYCPLISNGYACIKNENLQNFTSGLTIKNSGTIIGSIISNLGLNNLKNISDEVAPIKIDKVLEVTKIQKNHIENYYNVIKNNVPNTAYSKEMNEKIKVDDETYKVNSYILSLEEKESANLQIDLFEKLSQDSIMMDFITSKFKLLNMNENYTNINKLNERIQNKIKELKADSSNAKKVKITVSEYKQKNIQTKIEIGDYTIIINHLKEEKDETSIFTLNNTSIKINKNNSTYNIKATTIQDETKKSIEITYNQTGSTEENNIKNITTITLTNGIKLITFAYNDQVTFDENLGNIKKFEGSNIAILNEFGADKVNSFIEAVKQKINQTYISKGSSIGINLDPIFQ